MISEDKLYPFANADEYINGLKLEPDCGNESLMRSKLLSLKFFPPMYAIISPESGLIDINDASAYGIWSKL